MQPPSCSTTTTTGSPGGDMIYHWVCAQKPEMGRCQEQLNGVTSLRVSADWEEERAGSPTAAILILPSSASTISTRPERGSHSPSAREGAGRKKEGTIRIRICIRMETETAATAAANLRTSVS
jgi:hypothetical protein